MHLLKLVIIVICSIVLEMRLFKNWVFLNIYTKNVKESVDINNEMNASSFFHLNEFKN